MLAGLKDKNHDLEMSYGIAIVGSIRNKCAGRKKACIEAVTDGRKGGTPAGI